MHCIISQERPSQLLHSSVLSIASSHSCPLTHRGLGKTNKHRAVSLVPRPLPPPAFHHSSILQTTVSWVGPGTKATEPFPLTCHCRLISQGTRLGSSFEGGRRGWVGAGTSIDLDMHSSVREMEMRGGGEGGRVEGY